MKAADWPVFGFDQAHSANNTQEALITPANAATYFAATPLFSVSLPAIADGSPVELTGIPTAQGARNLVFLTTKAGHIIALDAMTGARVWGHQYPAGTCVAAIGPCFTTSSPVIDPNKQFVYSYGLDGNVHKYQVADGTEITTGGWPEVATLKGFTEKGSAALSVATAPGGTSYLYVANGGYPGDAGDYQGHVTTINLSTGSQTVFNTMCSDQAVHFVTPGMPDCAGKQSAVWARPGVVYSSATNRVYFGTGNGTYDPALHEWGDSVLAVNPDGTGASGNPLDAYTPANFAALQNTDTDLGSTAPAILPVPAASAVQHLAVQGGKDGLLRLLNLDNLSGLGGPGHTGGNVGSTIFAPGGCEVLTQPAVWVNPADQATWVFVSNGCGISGIKLSVDGAGAPSIAGVWEHLTGGTSPVVANGVLFQAGGGTIRALDPLTGASLWSAPIGGLHWESPAVVNGTVYISDENARLSAYTAPKRAVLPALSNGAYGGYVSAISLQHVGTAAPAHVAIRYFDQAGESVGVGDTFIGLPLNAGWTVRQDNGHAFPSGGAGSAVIFSDEPIAAIVNEFAPGNVGDGTSYTGLAPAATSPQWAPAIASNAYGGYTTGLGLLNSGSTTTTITITYRDGAGTIAATQTLPNVPAFGYRAVYSGNSGQPTDANLPAGFAGTATISATGGGFIAAIVNETGPGGQLSSYGVVQQANAVLHAPAALNRAYGGYITGMGVQNTTGNPGTVTVTYHDASGATAGTPVVLAIAADGYLGVYQGDPSQGPPVAATGYTATLSSTVAIAAIVNEVGPAGSGPARQSTSYNTIGAGTAGAAFPVVENSGSDGWSTGQGVMNLGGATTITLTYHDVVTGAQIGSPVTQALPANAFWGPYQPMAGLPAGTRATATMTATPAALIAAICNETNGSTFMSYNGQ